MAELRTLIDFATGENWEMPIALYEHYHRVCGDLQIELPENMTCIQYWLSMLPKEERSLVTKK